MYCRLCLQTIGNNSQPVEESLLKFLKLNTNICKENVMCIDCANCLQVFSNFLPSCVYTGDRTLPLSDLQNGVKLEPEAFETKTNQKSFVETDIKCSFCVHTHGREDLISLKESKENKFLVNMLERCILETHLKNSEELLSCGTCLEALQSGLNVISNCLKVEAKISKYIDLVGADDKGQVELKNVQQFMFGAIELEDGCVQIQEEYTMMAETEIKDEERIINPELIIKTEDDDVTAEQSDCEVPHIKSEQNDYNGIQESSVENETPNEPLDISTVTSEMRKSKNRIKHLSTHESPTEIETLKCELCPYKTKRKGYFRQHLLLHKSPSGMKMLKCKLCSFETLYGHSLKQHLLTHKSASEIEMFKCELCSYEAKQKYHLKRHYLLNHKNPSEIKMFKCELCPYKTKYKGNFKLHFLNHKSPSEITTFKCASCLYEAKHKYQLQRHLLTHKNPSEIKMFNCELCSYKTKRKPQLTQHLLTHRSPSEINMLKCEMCPFETKYKQSLVNHLLTHKDPSQIKMFKCESCPYEAKQKSLLNKHQLTHKNPSEIEMFKCQLCSYETKVKRHLTSHLSRHKSPPETKMFKCEFCSYETRVKSRLKSHLFSHKSPANNKMFKCELCSYEVKGKSDFKIHLLTHKSPFEIKMYKYEINLNTQSLAHENLFGITKFKCELCPYETKCKVNFIQHLSIHESRQELKIFI